MPSSNLPASERVTSYAWLVVGLLWFVALLNYLDRLTVTSMRDWIVADIPMSDARFGLLTSVFLWVYGVCSPMGGFLADRYSRKWVILVSLAVWSIVTWWTGHVHTFEALLLVRGIMGVSEACYIAAALALIADYHSGPTRSLATGLHQSGLYAGAALGGAGGWIAAEHGWRVAFTQFGAIGVGYALVIGFVLRDRPPAAEAKEPSGGAVAPQKASFAEALRTLLRTPAFWVLMVYMALAAMAFWLVNGWLPVYLQDRFVGWSPEQLGPTMTDFLPSAWLRAGAIYKGNAGLYATVPVQIASFVGVVVGGIVADRWSRTNIRGRVILPAIGFMLAGPFLVLLAITSNFGFALFAMVIFGLGRGFSDANIMPILCQVVDSHYRATAYGILNLVGVTIGGGMIYVGGYLRDRQVGLPVPFAIAGCGLLLAGILLLAIRPDQRAPAEAE